MKKKKVSISGIIKWVIALLLVIMQVYPFFYVFTSSFKSLDDFRKLPAYALPSKWVLTNFINVFTKLFSVTPIGIINQILSFVNPSFKFMEWISNPQISLYVTAFVEAYKYLGLYMVIFYAALIGVPDELGEAALIDGAAVWQEYLYVKIPYIKPVIIANCLLVLNGSLRS